MNTTESPIFRSPGEDPEMEQAAALARKSFRFLWRELAWEQRRIVPALDMAAVKAIFSDPPEMRNPDPEALDAEHMWLMEVEFDGKLIHGTLINSPHSLRSIKEGDRVEISGRQLTDWMYAIEGEVYGGFTVDLMRSRMGRQERRQHDNAWGLNFGEPGVITYVPPAFLGKEPAKKGLFSRRSTIAEPQSLAEVSAAEHPMSQNMRESLQDALTQNPQMVSEPDERGFTLLHQLALAGSFDGVDVCLSHGADPRAKTQNGMTPMTLAKSLGWQRVMARLEQAGAT